MNQPTDAIRKELESLTCRVLDKQLSADEDARLTEILNMYPELIEDYTNQIHLDSLLSSSLYESVPEGVSFSSQEKSPHGKQTTHLGIPSAELPATRRFSFLLRGVALAMVVLLVSVAVWLNQKVPPQKENQIVSRPDYVGMLLDTEDAVWGNDDVTDDIPYGTQFEAGQSLWLKSGIARIRFQSGAGVVLEGPAKIEVRSPLNALLHYGKLAAYVPDDVQGFSVDTSKIRILDLGTRFGTVVDPSGEAEVHVFEGEVDVKPVTAENKKITNLKASQALRFSNGTVQGAEISVTPSKFADVPTDEQLIAAKSGNYPPQETIRFENQQPLNQISLIKENSALPAGILVGEDFEYPSTSLYQQSGGVGFSHEGWWVDQNFTRLMVPEKRMQWGDLSGGPMVLQARGHHHAYPSLAHRLARKLEIPLKDDFYFSMLVQYHGLDGDDFFGLWFDDSMGGMGNSHSRVPSIGFKEGQFFARFTVQDEILFQEPADHETFLLVGHLAKNNSPHFNHLEFWVNPVGERVETPDVVVELPKEGKLLKSINALGVRIGQYTEVTDSLFLDRLVIGDTYEAVTQPAEAAAVQK